MKARKPRFARYELERMSIKELVSLNRGRSLGIGEKKDLIQFLIDHERIDLIPTPEPVEYKMEDLRAMRVSELKRAMADAGVFFHAKDVVEKSDMISIFVNSGRLNLIPVEEAVEQEEARQDFVLPEVRDENHESSCESQKATHTSKRPLVETVDEEEGSDPERKRPTNMEEQPTPVVMFPSVTSPVTCTRGDETPPTSRSIPMSGSSDTPRVASSSVGEESSDPQRLVLDPPNRHSVDRGLPDQSSASTTADNAPASPGVDDCASSDVSLDDPESPLVTLVPPSADLPIESQPSTEAQESVNLPPREISTNAANEPQLADCPLKEYSVAQLLSLGREANIDLSSCFERSEMVNLLVAAGVTGRTRVDLHTSTFADWSVSQLRAVASEVNIDLSQCSDQTEIVDRILQEANFERPHLRTYLRVLSPLTTSSLYQLRATARAWDVDISDCLEKEEIIQRLFTRANQFGIC
jgi:hypothetical protein